ncbi:ankyrin repeat and MYND domain-containing protein 1 [Myotis lucifugus]|uniref:ankyrin repeat and MYND domain-containing protein 1 n=1 Tax=Myotis lucifugus TaxID=59463 RepID=UPI000CCC92AA|nr:ankyrin repeat and MYND domain-containing protein 1 [Myotis lucifugus]
MEGGYSSDQLERRGSEPTLNEDSGTLESSILFTKRNIPEAPEEEEEEPQAPLREQDLKETYIQLVQGVQEWQDGCVYRGHFGLDMKLGYGEFSWPTGESYHGQFYRDHRHGFGTYMWPDGSSFTGMFYLSFREGYGTMYMKTRLFQGLYKADERFGPGIETYPDGSQEVGLWFREHLIKLCTEIPCSVSISSYPEFQGFLTHSPARISLSEEETMHWDLQEERDPFFYNYKQFLLNDDLTLPPDVYLYSTDNTHMPITRSFRRDLDSRIFLHDIPPFVEDGEPWFIKNETPLMVKIQKHTYKFRNKKEHSSWNMGAILEGDRSGFACRGPKERLAKEMILKAEEGNYDWIYGILRDNLASPDVADARGYTVLAAAAIHCHINIINLLLDNGADVNKCTDEGLTPLNMCFLLYYPATSFRPNIAERTVPEPQCFPKEIQKLSVSHYSSFAFHDSDSIYNDDLVPISESPKSSVWRDSPQKWESTLPRGSVSISDQGQELEDVLESLDRCTPCSSTETNFESNHCVQNYSIRLSWNMLEKSARAYSMLKVPSPEAISDKGTMRQMAWTMTNCDMPEMLPSSMKLNNEVGPPRVYSSVNMSVPEEGGRTPLHVACEREDNYRYARDVVHLLLSNRANSSLLWGGHSPLSLSIASGNDLIVKELLTNGADPNLPLTKGLGNALCVACDIAYEHRRSVNSRLGLIDLLINYGADILAPVTLTQGDKVAVGTAVDYGYFKFFQDRKIAHCPFHTLMPAERETFVARKRLLEYMGFQLRSAIMAKESLWDPKVLCLSKKAQMIPCHKLKQRDPSTPKDPQLEELEQTPFFKFCYQCGRSIGVRLLPCSRCYGILTCSKSCKTKAWADFHGRDCGTLAAIGRKYLSEIRKKFKKSVNKYPEPLGLLLQLNKVYTSYSHE